MNNIPRFFKAEDGRIINLSTITQMYMRTVNQCMIEFVNGKKYLCQISQEDFERIYNMYSIDRVD